MKLGPLTIINSERSRSGTPLSLQEYGNYFTYLNHQYPLFGYGPSLSGQEP